MATDRGNGPAIHEAQGLASANDAAFASAPAQLRTLGHGASRVLRANEESKRDELWRGDAFDPYHQQEPSVPVYVRVAQAAPLVAELLCAVVARAIGLPAPQPYVVLIEPGALPGSKLAPPQARALYVGTQDIGGSTFAQILREDSQAAQNLLRGWAHLVPVTTLDEWLANPDRNLGNILYVAQTLHIIDHAEAFGGSARQLFPLAEITRESFSNKLADLLATIKTTAPQRQDALSQAQQWLAQTAQALDIPATVASVGITRWQSPQDEAELINFIITRLTITHSLLCNRLGHPQLALSS